MELDRHYGDSTRDIRLDNLTPFANSLPVNKCFLGKKFQKIVKNSVHDIEDFMNVIFEKPQKITAGQLMKWSLHGLVLDVYVIDDTKLFVKGKDVWAYAVGIIK